MLYLRNLLTALFVSVVFLDLQHGGVYKLAFGPKAFVVISDPIIARHVLRENAFSYDKVTEYSVGIKKHFFCFLWHHLVMLHVFL